MAFTVPTLTLFAQFILAGYVRGLSEPQVLEASDLTNGTFRVRFFGDIKKNCLSENITYHRLLGKSPRWTIPHSLISMDGKPCGALPKNATERELDGDPWMEVFPYGLIADISVAQKNGLFRPFSQIASVQDNLRDYLKFVETEIGMERASREIFIGYEPEWARHCGNITVPQHSFVVFARNYDEKANFADLLYGSKEETLKLMKGAAYHVQFAPTESKGVRFCPYLLPPDYYRKFPIRACFPANARVYLSSGEEMRMENLRLGDKVAYIDDHGRRRYSPVILFTHQDSSTRMHEFVRVKLGSGHTLSLSPGHFVDEERTAEDITPGNLMRTADGSYSPVIEVQRVQARGLFNPQTISGLLLVNDVSVTAYTKVVKPAAAHSALLPFRIRWQVKKWEISSRISVMLIRFWRAALRNCSAPFSPTLPAHSSR